MSLVRLERLSQQKNAPQFGSSLDFAQIFKYHQTLKIYSEHQKQCFSTSQGAAQDLAPL